jgi:uncharacterized phage-associated protein
LSFCSLEGAALEKERQMAPTTANDIADHILCQMHEVEDLITNLKIQKLVYYAQAWYLAIYNEPLFDDRLEAWPHGPVQPELYRRFKRYQWKPIDEQPDPCPKFVDPIKEHLKEILDVYGDLTAHHLERLTHKEDPWKNARGDLPLDAPCTNAISHEDMKDFYRRLADNGST